MFKFTVALLLAASTPSLQYAHETIVFPLDQQERIHIKNGMRNLLAGEFLAALDDFEIAEEELPWGFFPDSYCLIQFGRIIAFDALHDRSSCVTAMKNLAFFTYKASELVEANYYDYPPEIEEDDDIILYEEANYFFDYDSMFDPNWQEIRKQKSRKLIQLINQAPSPEIQALLFLLGSDAKHELFSVL